MRKRLLTEGAKELSYEIREIVKKANLLKTLGMPKIHWENIGDPIEKKCQVPEWIKESLWTFPRKTVPMVTARPRVCWKPANSS